MQLSINIPQDKIEQISSRVANRVVEEVIHQLKENFQKLGVKVELEGKVDDATHKLISCQKNKVIMSENTERFNAFYDREILKADVTNLYEIAVKAYQEGIKQGRRQEQINELNCKK